MKRDTPARRAALGFLALVACGGPAAPAAAELRYDRLRSESLGREVAVTVQLPPSYAQGQAEYPVLYVLHGLFESQAFWERRGLAAILDGLWSRQALPEFLVVAIDGGNSFFVNGREGRFEDLVTRDAIAWTEARYRVRRGREGRALLGVSMGGYAALRLAFTHPSLYRAVATHSAMLLLHPPTPEEGARQWHLEAFHGAFGEPLDAALWSASDPLALAARADPRALPALFFDCGSEDRYRLFEGNRRLHETLLLRGAAHEFALRPGDHGYEYVRSVLERSLGFVSSVWRAGQAGPAAGR